MRNFEMYVNNARFATVDFGVAAGLSGTSVSSAIWSVDDGSSVTLSNETVSSNVAQCLITSQAYGGCNVILCKATMADGQKISEYFKVKVSDPEC